MKLFIQGLNSLKNKLRLIFYKIPLVKKLLTRITFLEETIRSLEYQIGLRWDTVELFTSYFDAQKNCNTLDMYENSELLKIIKLKQLKFLETLRNSSNVKYNSTVSSSCISILLSSLKKDKKSLKVIDFGGAYGAIYNYLHKILGEEIEIFWYIVETPKLVSMAGKFCNRHLKFFSSLDKAIDDMGQPDLVFTSGAIQYVPKPYETVKELCDLDADFMFFNRTAFTTGPYDVISIQKSRIKDNGEQVDIDLDKGISDQTIEYPVSYIQKSKFLDIITRKYQLHLEFDVESGFHRINQEPVTGNAMFFEKKR